MHLFTLLLYPYRLNRRIGLASNVSSHTPGGAQQPTAQLSQHIIPPSTIGSSVSSPPPSTVVFSSQRPQTANSIAHTRTDSITDGSSDTARLGNPSFNTSPALGGLSRVDEFGRPRGDSTGTDNNTNELKQIQTIGGPTRPSVDSEGVRLRARSNTANTVNRLTVTNFADDMPEEVKQQQAQQQQQIAARTHARQASFTPRTGPAAARSTGWLTAEEEKKRLYENAQAKVEAAHQGNIPRASSPPVRRVFVTTVKR